MKSTRIISLFLLLALLVSPVMATEAQIGWDEVYCFSGFTPGETGVLLTAVPEDTLGTLQLEGRRIIAGDVLTAEQLSRLTFVPAVGGQGEGVITCLSLGEDGTVEPAEMTLKVGKNQSPVAEDQEFTTYKNIPGQVTLNVSDPEDDSLTITIVKEPKRGEAAVNEDGTVTYTPKENKVGHDSFTYTVTDAAGNTSEEATVRITIRKASDKETYGDMSGHPAELAAVWLREEGIYSGDKVSGQLLFHPDEPVTRGTFIAMAVALTDSLEEAESLSTGFVDEEDTDGWLRPYAASALRCGYITGVPTAEGLALDPDSPITQAQAAKIVSNLLALPETNQVSLMEDGSTDWASGAIDAMAEAELFEVSDRNAGLTRAQAAMLLYDTWQAAQKEENTLLSWAKE